MVTTAATASPTRAFMRKRRISSTASRPTNGIAMIVAQKVKRSKGQDVDKRGPAESFLPEWCRPGRSAWSRTSRSAADADGARMSRESR